MQGGPFADATDVNHGLAHSYPTPAFRLEEHTEVQAGLAEVSLRRALD